MCFKWSNTVERWSQGLCHHHLGLKTQLKKNCKGTGPLVIFYVGRPHSNPVSVGDSLPPNMAPANGVRGIPWRQCKHTILSRITAKHQPTIHAILAHVSETSGSFQVWSWVHSIAANGSHVGTVTPHYMLYWMHECMVSFLCCTNISRWGLIIISSFEVKRYNPSYQVV